MAFEALDTRDTTVDQVYRAVRAAILNGDLAQGEQIGEARVASSLGVSRAPLREALRRLEEEQLVERVAFRGAFVKNVRREVIDEITSLRKVLEPYAVRVGLDWLCDEGRDQAETLLAELRTAAADGDAELCVEKHLALHRLLYSSTGNGTLLSTWDTWESQLRLYLSAELQSVETPEHTQESCQQLWDTIQSRDLAAIERDLDAHIKGFPIVDG